MCTEIPVLMRQGMRMFAAPEDNVGPVGFLFQSPDSLSFHRRLVATDNLVTATPLAVNFVSALRPRWPISNTLFTLSINRFSYLTALTTGRAARNDSSALFIRTAIGKPRA